MKKPVIPCCIRVYGFWVAGIILKEPRFHNSFNGFGLELIAHEHLAGTAGKGTESSCFFVVAVSQK